MGNSYFKFKQFTVHQDACAMKVCTDAALFGNWVGKRLQQYAMSVQKVLDIGTGTGLLSLLLAQHLPGAAIDAIEIDEAAAKQAAANFAASPWSKRLHIQQADARVFSFPKKYDVIICNPPFYQDDLKSNNASRNVALHGVSLNFKELLHVVQRHLHPDGLFAVLLHYAASPGFIQLAAAKGLFVNETLHVKQTPKHDFFRIMLLFTHAKKDFQQRSLNITNEDGTYSEAFREISF